MKIVSVAAASKKYVVLSITFEYSEFIFQEVSKVMIISKKKIMFQWTKHFNMTCPLHVPSLCTTSCVPAMQCNVTQKHCTNVTSWFNIDMGRFMTILERYFSTSREIPMHVCSARCPGGGVVQCTLYPSPALQCKTLELEPTSRRLKFHKSQSQRREKAPTPTRASCSWLKALTITFTFKTLLRHCGLMPV